MRSPLHIGGNKTGSTLLQQKLFSQHPQIAYLGEDCKNFEQIKTAFNYFIHEDDCENISNKILELFTITDKRKKVFVFSSEDIMGSRHPSLVARRFKSIMPNAKVAMVIRNQITALSSWYVTMEVF